VKVKMYEIIFIFRNQNQIDVSTSIIISNIGNI